MSNRVVVLTLENQNIIARICQLLASAVKKQVLNCAAKLIFYFKGWRDWKLQNHRTEWIYVKLEKIRQDLLGEYSLHVIRAAIDLMMAGGILDRRDNPGNKQDRTYQYQLKVDTLTELAAAVEKEQPDSNPLEDGEFRSESPKFTVEKSVITEDLTQKSDPNGTDDRVFSGRQEKTDSIPEKPQKKEKTVRDPEIDWQVYNHLLGELEGTGIPKTKQIEQYLRKSLRKWGAAAAARVQDAIAAFKQAKNIQNPGGWLVTAIERGFKPNQPRSQGGDTSPEPLPAEPGRSPLPPSSPTMPGFRAWFDQAKLLGLVIASANDVGGVRLFLPDGNAIAWESFARHYPLEKLDEIANWLRVASSKLGATRARIEGSVVMIDFLGEPSVTWEAAQRTYRDLL